MSSDAELKRRILRLIEEDEEFRLAVAGAIGLREILEELRWLKRRSLEQDKRFEAIERKLLEHDRRFEAIEKKLLEHDKRFEAIERKLLEHDRRFEIIERKLLEHDKRFEAIERKLLEHDEKFRAVMEEIKCIKEDIRRIWETLVEHSKRISRVEDMVGAVAESMYSKFLLDALIYELTGRGERLERWERNARVDGEDIDLLVVAEKTVYVVEVKLKPKPRDVGALLAKAELVSQHYPDKTVIPVLTGTRVGREVAEYAARKGVRVVAW